MASSDEVSRLIRVYREYEQREHWSDLNAGNRAILEERRRVLGRILAKHDLLPLADRRILDVGCGQGQVLASLMAYGAAPGNLFGLDLLPQRIDIAKQRFPEIHFRQGNAERLTFVDGFFDLVLLFTVFSSILDAQMALNVSREVRRILKPGGAVLWYDFRYNNPNNPNVRGMSRKAMTTLFPDFSLHIDTLTLLPPLARRLGRATSWLYPALSALPVLRTHYLGLLIKPKQDDACQTRTLFRTAPKYIP